MSTNREPIDLAAVVRRSRLRGLRAQLAPIVRLRVARPRHVVRPAIRAASAVAIRPMLVVGLIALVLGALVGADLIGLVPDCPSFRDPLLYDTFAPPGSHATSIDAAPIAWLLWATWMAGASSATFAGVVALRRRLAAERARRRPLDPVREWLAELAYGLRDMAAHQRRSVVNELTEHLRASHQRDTFADVDAISERFGDARRLARAIARAKSKAPRAAKASRDDAAGWIAIGVACLWHVALAIELGVSANGGTDGRRMWWDDAVARSPAAKRALHDVLAEFFAGLAAGRPVAWLLALWALLGVNATLAGLALLRRPDPEAPRPARV